METGPLPGVKGTLSVWVKCCLIILTLAGAQHVKLHIIVHLQATFFSGFGKPVCDFLVGLQVDIVPKGCTESACQPFGHRLCTKVQVLEAQLEASAEDVFTVVGVPILSLSRNDDMKNYYQKQLEEIAQKCLAVISKYKRTQLTLYDELRVFDPSQRDSRTKSIPIFSLQMKWRCCVHLVSGSCIGSNRLLMTLILMR